MENKWKVPFNLQLIVTEECNLRCAYCFEIDKNPRTMPVKLAKEILERELSGESGFSQYQIDLAGGEPFLIFDDLREIVDYGVKNARRWNKKIFFFICSNLTLLNEKIKTWLQKNRECVILGTSLDGTKEAHDLYRCNSYDEVERHLPFYRELYPQQGVKMTVGPSTLASLYEGILNIESLGLEVSANVVYEPVWGEPREKMIYLKEFARQLDLLVDHYAANPQLPLPTLMSLPIRLFNRPQEPDHHWCGSGRTMRAYDTDGRVLPCHRFSRFCTNKIYLGEESWGPKIETKCDQCSFAVSCPTCPGYNWQVNGHPDSRTANHCEFIQLQFLAAAKLEFLRNQAYLPILTGGSELEKKAIPERSLENLLAAGLVMRSLNENRIISGVLAAS